MDIINLLSEYKFCFRCVMRIIKNKNYDEYRKSDLKDKLINKGFYFDDSDYLFDFENKSLEENYIGFINKLKNICRICLGILQIVSNKDFIKNIKLRINKNECDFDDFQIHIKIPISLKLRYFYFISNIKKKINPELIDSINVVENIELKQVFKWVLGPLLSIELDKKPKYEEDFNLTFDFTNIKDEIKFNNYFKQEIKNHYNQKLKKNKKIHEDFEVKNVLTTNYYKLIIEKHNQNIDDIIDKNDLNTNLSSCNLEFTINSQNIYLFGNYIKFQRNISQTPWEINGVKIVF